MNRDTFFQEDLGGLPLHPKPHASVQRDRALLTLLQLFGKSYSRKEYLDAVVQWLRGWSGFRCIGVRVLDLDGYVPYESFHGFSQQFWEAENWISTTRDHCICLRVVTGNLESQDLPAITREGSFRTNNSFKFISGVPQEQRCRFRGVCVEVGFASLVVMPIRYRGTAVGVLHLADEREGRASAPVVEFLEKMAPVIGEAIHRFNLEDELRQNHEAETALNTLLRLSLEETSIEDLLSRTIDLLRGIPWLDFEEGVIRLASGAPGSEREGGKGYRIPIVSSGKILGTIDLTMNEGHHRRQIEERFLGAVANVLAGILMRKRAEEQLLRAQRLEMAGRIASQVAHDFNNLLSPLAGYPQLIKRQLPEGHPATRYCDALMQSARQMVAINDDLLALGRRGRVNHETADLNQLVEQTLARLSEDRTGLDVQVDLSEGLPRVVGSQAQLARVVSNLVSNAREAMEDAGALSISTDTVRLREPLNRYSEVREGHYVRLRVADTGCGIPARIIESVFDPFFSTKSANRQRGSGLGLSIVQSIVEDYQGYLDVESRVGEGTTFTVYLPVAGRDGSR